MGGMCSKVDKAGRLILILGVTILGAVDKNRGFMEHEKQEEKSHGAGLDKPMCW